MDFTLINQIQVLPFDTASTEGKNLLYYNDQYFEVSVSLAELLKTIQELGCLSKAAVHFSHKTGKTYSEEDMTAIVEKFITPIFQKETEKPSKNKTFIFKVGLLPPQSVKTIATRLRFFLQPKIALFFLLLILTCEILFFTSDLGVIHSLSGANGYIIAGVLGLFVMSSLFHEMGHAAACRYFNAENGGVGFGLYISFPVFYTDVTNIWRLTRKQRIIVNFSGVYFQLLFLLPFFVIYFLTGDNIPKLFIYTINLNFLFTLNPFFKFDGYWIMSDLMGVPNLRSRSMEYFTYLFQKLRKKEASKPFLLSLRPMERFAMIAYSLVVNIFFLYFFVFVIPRIIYNFISLFPRNASHIVNNLAQGIWPGTSLIVNSIFQVVMFGFIVLFLYKMLIKLIKGLQPKNI